MAANRVAWPDKRATPEYVQIDFGRFGAALPLHGEESCGATAIAMSMMWLYHNGFTQLSSAAGPPRVDDLVRVFDGLSLAPLPGAVVDYEWYRYVVTTYLYLKGIGPTQVKIDRQVAPSIAWFAAKNQEAVVNFAIGWYDEDPNTPGSFQRKGQHWLTLIAVDPAASVLTINNPYPSTFFAGCNIPGNCRQVVRTAPFAGTTVPSLPAGKYIQTNVPFANPSSGTRAIIETAYAWTIDESVQPAEPGYDPQPFVIGDNLVYVNVRRATLEVTARLQGRGGIQKRGPGKLVLTRANTTSGTNEIHEGLVVSTEESGMPFGTGSIKLIRNGGLVLRPEGAQERLVLAVASGDGQNLDFAGGNSFELDRGAHDALAVTVGGRTDGHSPNLVRSGNGTLVVIPRSGLDELGRREQLWIGGGGGNWPPVTKGMVDPSIVGQDRDGSGSFLTYGGTGFAIAQITSSLRTSLENSTKETVYAVEDDQMIPADGAVSAYALCVGPHIIDSGGRTTLQIGDPGAFPRAGVILNGASIRATTLQFGDAEGLVYKSGDRNEIASNIQGLHGVTFFGPGSLKLTGTNNAYRGGSVIDSGTVTVANRAGTGLGTGDVLVRSGGTLVVEGAVEGKVNLERDSHLILAGGAIGGIAIRYGGHMATGGILEGGGTIRGASDIRGTISARRKVGKLTFEGPVTFSTTSFYWNLTRLDDTPGGEGKYWNSLEFTLPTSLGTQDDPIWILLEFPHIPDPDSDDPFWGDRHKWLLARFHDSQDLYYDQGNFVFTRGSFSIFQSRHEAYLFYEPWAT